MAIREKLIIGNWKLNGSKQLINELLEELDQDLSSGIPDGFSVAICPPSIYVSELVNLSGAHGSSLTVGCQNVSHFTQGSFTGELSARMIKDAGGKLCLVGHSERRTIFSESDHLCHDKISALLAEGITPVLCIGESLGEKEAGQTSKVLRDQLSGALSNLDLKETKLLHIAYEPVYAIGTGYAITPEQAQSIHLEIRKILADLIGSDLANKISVLYGGSVTRDNAQNLIARPDVDGLLIGGASLSPEHFHTICKNVFSLAPNFSSSNQSS
jgi:triosephosphate isomerase (TIM)